MPFVPEMIFKSFNLQVKYDPKENLENMLCDAYL